MSVTINKSLSLFIPHVFKNFSGKHVAGIFEKLGFGIIERVDIVPHHKGKSHFNNAFVHFHVWYETGVNSRFQERVLNPEKEARIVHDDPWFWVVLPNINGGSIVPQQESNRKGNRKQTINLSAFGLGETNELSVQKKEEEDDEEDEDYSDDELDAAAEEYYVQTLRNERAKVEDLEQQVLDMKNDFEKLDKAYAEYYEIRQEEYQARNKYLEKKVEDLTIMLQLQKKIHDDLVKKNSVFQQVINDLRSDFYRNKAGFVPIPWERKDEHEEPDSYIIDTYEADVDIETGL